MRRLAAIGSLGFGVGAVVLAVVLAVERFPRGIAVLACLAIALVAAWAALRGVGVRRQLAAALGGAALIGAVVLAVALDEIFADLTPAELRVLRLLPSHLSYRQIAGELIVSPNTVKTQIRSAYLKLGVSSRHEAVEFCREAGIEQLAMPREEA